MHRPSKKAIATVGAAVLVGAGAGAGGYAAFDRPAAPTVAPATSAATTVSPAAARSGDLSINQIFRAAGPGVVDITATSTAGSSTFPFGQGNGSQQAEGSGFVLDGQGHVVTNQHVVDGASTIKVKFQTGATYTATVVGTDPSTDIAVLKVDAPASALHPLTLGDSSKVVVGDGVIAIGSPFGLEESVTAGIVSALDRQITAPNQFSINGAIQTDAAINHGNSGGPLIDLQGDVIGVDAQIESDSGDNAGVGFAIPSNTVRTVAAQLIASGKALHAYLGVQVGATSSGGAKITLVRSGTPADKAGLQIGDVVTKVDSKAIADPSGLETAIDAKQPGDSITLTFTRNGAEKTATVTLGTRPTS